MSDERLAVKLTTSNCLRLSFENMDVVRSAMLARQFVRGDEEIVRTPLWSRRCDDVSEPAVSILEARKRFFCEIQVLFC
jgi:hypothetical protein